MTYRLPFNGSFPVTQRYGEKYTSSFHTGIDFATPEGTPIFAAEAGKIIVSKRDTTSAKGGYGEYITILHNDGKASLYAHLRNRLAAEGFLVQKGALIGYSGNTGNSTGAHLHFEMRLNWADYKSHFDPFGGKVLFDSTPTSTPTSTPISTPGFQNLDNVSSGKIVGEVVNLRDENGNVIGSINNGVPVNIIGTKKTFGGLPYRECELKVYIAEHNGTYQLLGKR